MGGRGGSIYDVNHATIDFLLKRYLASNSTCAAILDYGSKLVNRCIGKRSDDYEGGSGSEDDGNLESGDREEAMAQKLWPDHARKPTPVSRHIGPSYCNDGGPTFAMQRLIEENHQSQPMQAHF